MAKRQMPAQQPATSKQDYRTEIELLTAVKHRLGINEFDCDIAADADNTVADCYYDRETNALAAGNSWKQGDGWNWLNPEFGMIAEFVEKAWWSSQQVPVVERAQTIVLVPASVGSNWWAYSVHNRARVWFMNGRTTFMGHTQCYPKDTALLVYGPSVIPGYEVWRWRNAILVPER